MAVVDGLPAFMRFNEPRTSRWIRLTDDGEFSVDGIEQIFQTMTAAYDHVRRELGEEPRFDLDDGFYLDPTTNRILSSYDPDGDRVQAADEYESFLTNAVTYRADPDDFFAAYQFVNTHPVFWYHIVRGDGDIAWDYNGYASGQNALDVYRDEDTNAVRYLIEPVIYTGENRERDQRVLDTNLVVIESGFDEAIIALAERIDRYYDDTGDDRENVPNTAYTQHLVDKLAAYQAGDGLTALPVQDR